MNEIFFSAFSLAITVVSKYLLQSQNELTCLFMSLAGTSIIVDIKIGVLLSRICLGEFVCADCFQNRLSNRDHSEKEKTELPIKQVQLIQVIV